MTKPSFGEAFRLWAKLGFINFGGPAAQIAMMHRMLVDERRWVGETRFLHALNYCTLLPGPEAQQLATYIGWLLHRTLGGIVAGSMFILPGFLCVMALSWLYAVHGDVPLVSALFYGLQAAILAIVFQAVVRIGKRALGNRAMVTLAALAFVALFFLQVPFPLVVGTAAAAGFLGHRFAPELFKGSGHGGGGGAADKVLEDGADHLTPSTGHTVAVALIGGALWLGPVAILWIIFGWQSTWTQLGVFFSEMAVVTFGGAYAVLAYVAQEAVNQYGWLEPEEMLSGLALAETTPGPLILVVQFVGFLAGYRDPGTLDPSLAGALAATLVVWVTFVPSFLWILVGAPYIERLRGLPRLDAALTAITAAIVGVILNLAIWFALHVVFAEVRFVDIGWIHLPRPNWATLDPAAVTLALASAIALFRFNRGVVETLAGAAVLGMAWRLLV
ncbi:MAG: chromate efflux transporter [Alphaproteobacteria bacterium]|nr:chromate efflux transporter [Alphaproteobacteria bacterium]